jgi:tetratricopeptide (TPR) repeat protein
MTAGRLYHHLMALITARNSRESALTHINQAIDYLPAQFTRYDSHAFFMDAQASLYFKTGFVSDAQQTYEKILALTVGRLMYGHLCGLSHYRLAKIFQARGWRGKAIEHYQRFLMLWRDADPGLPESADARKQLNTVLASR